MTVWLNFPERRVPWKSCSSFSALSTPWISKVLPFCLTPNTIHPPEVFENALTVSHIFFGNSDFADLTSKSSHSMSRSRATSSSFVITDAKLYIHIGFSIGYTHLYKSYILPFQHMPYHFCKWHYKCSNAPGSRCVAEFDSIPVGSRTPIVGTGIQYSIHWTTETSMR